MKTIKYSTQFKKDFKKYRNNKKKVEKKKRVENKKSTEKPNTGFQIRKVDKEK